MFGTVKGFDSFLIVLESNGVQNVIYKHAVSTVIPSRSINLLGGELQQSEEVQEAKEAV